LWLCRERSVCVRKNPPIPHHSSFPVAVESSITEKQRQIDQLSNEQKILEDLLAKLKLCADEGSDMFGRLANFSDMWSTVSGYTRSDFEN
jgi:methylaspartate ammonia-lyase